MKMRINANLRGPQASDVAVGSKPIKVAGNRRARLMGANALAGGALRGLAIAAGMVTIFGAAPARAQTSWTDATGSSFNAANWSAGAPPNAFGTTVDNGGTANIDAPALADAGLHLDINQACSAPCVGSTVNLQAPGSSLRAGIMSVGGIDLGTNGTLLLSGSTAVNAPFFSRAARCARPSQVRSCLPNNAHLIRLGYNDQPPRLSSESNLDTAALAVC
jgi:hypothetical protein